MIKKYTLPLLILLFCMFSSQLGLAQNISGIVNTYVKVTQITGNQFTVGTPDGRNGANIQDFDAGQKILIYQAKGASINTSNNNQFGEITSFGNAGKYEIATVSARSGSVITFSNLVNSYDVNGLVQLVYIPIYTDVSVTSTLRSEPWDKSNGYGGVVVLEANILTLKANISVDGEGFEGGARSNNNGNSCITVYRTTDPIYGEKGEGITTHSTYTRGQGPLANGGGGGSTHNGGGGGGSNHGTGAQGGLGWNCSSASFAGGLAGYPMSYTSTSQRLFFGGGGGGGQQNNSIGTNGGNGGGLVILLIKELTTNCSATRTISARGSSSTDAGNDGAGGAGAGGVVYIHAQTYNPNTCNINLNVDGGNGGDVNTSATHGGGGGGGSGLIYSSIPFVTGINPSGNNGTDGVDDSGGSQSGEDGIDEPVDVVIEPQVPPGADPVKGPGGHTSKLRMWLKADADKLFANADLNTTIVNGQEVMSWENEAINTNYIDVIGGSSNATFLNSANDQLNYNGIVRLNNTDRNLRSEQDVSAQTLVVVTKSNSTNTLSGVVGWDNDKGIRNSSDNNSWNNTDQNDWSSGGGSFINGNSSSTHNQEWHIVYQERGTSYTDRMFVGGYYGGRAYTGDIAEVISYEDQLSDQEQAHVESYLALKYGITMPDDNYFSSSNQTIWSRTGGYATYHNDVVGIGRDDASNLNQTKSKSINSDAVVTFEAESTIPNREFFMWGNDNTVLSSRNITDIPAAWRERLARVWRVKRTGNPGSMKVSFDLSALGISNPVAENFALLIDNNLTFNNATEHTTGRSIDLLNNEVSFTAVSISNGSYFTLVTKKKAAPGGDITNLEFWLKADAGTGTTTSGGMVNPWEDQLEDNDAKKSGSIALPIYRTNRLNFNPVMDYSGSTNRAYTISNSGDINTTTFVHEKSFSLVFTTGTDIASRQVLYEQGGTARGVNAYINGGKLYVGAWNKVNDGTASNWGFFSKNIDIAAESSYLLTFNMQGNDSKLGKIELINSGKVEKTINNIGRLYSHSGDIGVGAMINDSFFEPNEDAASNNGFYFKGHFAELTYAKEYLDLARRNKVESYLALKYGITLDQSSAQNYTASDGSVVWSGSSNASFKTDIAGVARDDNTVLDQLKSKSVNASSILTIANGTNLSSPSNFATDNAYLIWGHNGELNTAITGDYRGKTNFGIARVWRVSENGTVGDVRLAILNADLPSAITTLLISSDPTFPNTAATRTITLSTGATREATANFSHGEYFTFSKTNNAPVLSNMEVAQINYCDGNESLTSSVTVADIDGDNLTAIITFESGYQASEDVLVYTIGTGVTLVSKTAQRIEIQASVSNMQTALREISYTNSQSSSSRTTTDRVISIIVNDGLGDSNKVTRTVKPGIVPSPIGIFY